MPRVHAVVASPVIKSFRVDSAAGLFDVSLTDKSTETFDVEVPDESEDWSIGVIVGPSGSGKSTVAKQAFEVIERFDWDPSRSILDGFPEGMSVHDITSSLSAVGFSSPPAWVRPYHVLSGGQQFRVDLARLLMLEKETVVMDEFTSVVDRTVAKIGSACVAKSVRSGRSKCKRFVAVTCHYDVLDWLEPDWVLDMSTAQLARGCLQRRPEIKVDVFRCHRKAWGMFSKHHYLSHSLNKVARCYVGVWDGYPVGFVATLPTMGYKGMRRVTRMVILPDFQGVGIGSGLLNVVAGHEAANCRISIRTSHPALIRSLKKSDRWIATAVSRGVNTAHAGTLGRKSGRMVGSEGRITVSFRYRKHQSGGGVACKN